MSRFEELINLKRAEKPNRYISVLAVVAFILAAICFCTLTLAGLGVGIILVLIGLNSFVDSYYLTGMFGDSELRVQLQNIMDDFTTLNNEKELNSIIASNTFHLFVRNNTLILSKQETVVVEYDLEKHEYITEKINTDFGLKLLLFLHSSIFSIINSDFKK